jgi:hypothetical protein
MGTTGRDRRRLQPNDETQKVRKQGLPHRDLGQEPRPPVRSMGSEVTRDLFLIGSSAFLVEEPKGFATEHLFVRGERK